MKAIALQPALRQISTITVKEGHIAVYLWVKLIVI